MSERFVEISVDRPDFVMTAHQHCNDCDNTGYTVSVDRDYGIVIEVSYMGISSATVNLTDVDLGGLIGVLTNAKERIEQLKIVEKLKGSK